MSRTVAHGPASVNFAKDSQKMFHSYNDAVPER